MPYGWQPKGEYIELTPQKSKGTQVFGLLSADNRLEAYSCRGSMNSRTVIAFLAKVEEWKEQQFDVFFLPTYSPHLNLIEILWRKIKYEWLEYERLASHYQQPEQQRG